MLALQFNILGQKLQLKTWANSMADVIALCQCAHAIGWWLYFLQGGPLCIEYKIALWHAMCQGKHNADITTHVKWMPSRINCHPLAHLLTRAEKWCQAAHVASVLDDAYCTRHMIRLGWQSIAVLCCIVTNTNHYAIKTSTILYINFSSVPTSCRVADMHAGGGHACIPACMHIHHHVPICLFVYSLATHIPQLTCCMYAIEVITRLHVKAVHGDILTSGASSHYVLRVI